MPHVVDVFVGQSSTTITSASGTGWMFHDARIYLGLPAL